MRGAWGRDHKRGAGKAVQGGPVSLRSKHTEQRLVRSPPQMAVSTLGFSPGSAANMLCGPGQVAQPLCAVLSVSGFVF